MSNKMNEIQRLFYKNAKSKIHDLEPEFWIGRYRVDFFIKSLGIVIEIDGHDAHKTKEQRTNDAQRERYLQRLGLTVIRFTGNEIYSNVIKCVEEVSQYIQSTNKKGLSENSIFIDLPFLTKATLNTVRYYQKEYPHRNLVVPKLSSILLEISSWLKLSGNYDIYILGFSDFFSNSIIELDVIKYFHYANGILDIHEEHVNVDFLVISICEYIQVCKGKYKEVVLVGDDLAYVPLLKDDGLISKLLRLDNEQTSMIGLGEVKWQDINYVVGTALGLELHEL